MARYRKDGSGNGKLKGGVTPPNNTGKKYKKHKTKEEDGRRNNTGVEIYHNVDPEQLKDLCGIGCTMREIQSVMGFDDDTISKYLKEYHGMTWKEFFRENADNFKMSLRRLQMRSAEDRKSVV